MRPTLEPAISHSEEQRPLALVSRSISVQATIGPELGDAAIRTKYWFLMDWATIGDAALDLFQKEVSLSLSLSHSKRRRGAFCSC